jgi:hypothetical protein
VEVIAGAAVCQLVYRKLKKGKNMKTVEAGTDRWDLPIKDVATEQVSSLLVQSVVAGELKAKASAELSPFIKKSKGSTKLK